MKNVKNLYLLALLLCSTFLGAQTIENFDLNVVSLKSAVNYQRTVSPEKGFLSMTIEGHKMDMNIVPNQLMSPELRAAYPGIKTYDLLSKDGSEYYGTMTLSEESASMMVHTHHGYRAINNSRNPAKMQIELGDDKIPVCTADNHISEKIESIIPEAVNKPNLVENGDFKRVYRMAIITTGEYYTLQGNNNSAVIQSVTTAVNGIQAIFEREMAINFELLTPFLYTNAATDPFIPDEAGGDGRVTQAVAAIDAVFNQSTYDIGHVLHQSVSGDNWSSGGVARLRAVCNEGFGTPAKAGGWSGSFSINTNSFFSLFGHEVGHMFGAEHTFNGSGGSCQDNIGSNTSYEIASGNTIMSYNGICDATQNIPSAGVADDYFHSHSLRQMTAHCNDVGSCAAVVQTGNSIPQIDASPCGESYTIPKDTPFFLKGRATDADGDNMTYAWEQYDEDGTGTSTQGFIGNFAANNRNCPIFRCYPPSTDSIRYFPRYDDYINGVNNQYEVLSKIDRSLTFRLTVRDNNPNGNAFAQDELTMQVAATGPLVVTAPNGTELINAGDDFTIRWDTNGSESLCDLVNVDLSIDGGFTFPIRIANSISYADEQYAYTFPPGLNSTTNARVKITCIDSECMQFFDLSDTAFEVSSDCNPNKSSICDDVTLVTDQGSNDLELDLSHVVGNTGMTGNELVGQITSLSPNSQLALLGPGGTGCGVIVNSRASESYVVSVGKSGTYEFDMDHSYLGETAYFSLFDEATYSPTSSCASLITSAGIQSSAGAQSAQSIDPSVTLEACKEYRIVFWSFGNGVVPYRLASISGPGRVYVDNISDPNFGYTYVAISKSTNQIVSYDDTGNFRDIAPGSYLVYGMSYEVMPTALDLNTIIGSSISDLAVNGDCVQLSENAKSITVNTACFIEDIVASQQSACDPATNEYSQELIVSYQLEPDDAMLIVNGQIFDITGSPQTVTLVGLQSNGGVLDIEAGFTTDEFCKLTVDAVIAAPENCCPFDFDLGGDRFVCIGDELILNAGDAGETYQWFKDDVLLADAGADIEILEDGFYTVIVTSAAGCAKREGVMVTYVELPVIEAVEDAIFCADDTYDFEVETDGTNVEIFRENISVAVNQATFSVNETGLYTVISKNDAGCSVETQFEVIVNPLPVLDLGDDIQACESDDVILNGGTDGVEYQWFALGVGILPETTSTLNATLSSQYRVTVTSADGCSSTDRIEVDLLPAPTLNFIGLTDTVYFCSLDPEGLSLSVNNPGEDIAWTLDGAAFSPTSTLSHISDQAGVYEVSSSNSIGCTTIDKVVAIQVETPVVDLGEDIVACNEYTLTSNVNADEYQWVKAGTTTVLSTTEELTVTETGVYLLTATNQGLCPSVDNIKIDILSAPTLDFVDVADTIVLCSSETAGLTISISNPGGLDVTWTLDGSEFTPTSAMSHNTDQAGLYQVSSGNTIGCTVMDIVEVVIVETPAVDLGEDVVACNEYILNANVTADEYQWVVQGTNTVLSTTDELTITETGVYQLTATNQDACLSDDNITVDILSAPTLDFVGVTDTVYLCSSEPNGLTISISNPGGVDVTWTLDGSEFTPTTAMSHNTDQAGLYQVSSGNIVGCTVMDMVEVVIVDTPVSNLGEDIVACIGSEVVLTAGVVADRYQWVRVGESATLSDTDELVVTESGVYLLTTVNQELCPSIEDISVEFVPGPTLEVSDDIQICAGDMGTLTANTNGDNIQWFKDGVILNGENDADLTVSESGEYSALVLGQTDCEVMASANVTVISAPTLTLDGDQSICINDSYMLDANTGVASDQYTYLYEGTAINVPNTTTMIEIDQEGQYEVIVTNENNCTATESITLTVNALPDVAIMGDATLCIGAMGQLVADGNGNSFAWTLNGNAVGTDNAQLDISQAGSYNVISTSAQGCINEAQYEVVSVDSPIIDLGDDLALCPGETVMIDAGDHTSYAWSTGEDSPMINITSSDPTMATTETISVVVTNSAACASTDELVVTFAPVISGSIVPSAPGVCPEGTLTLEATGGLYYEWQDPSGTLSAIDMAIVEATPSENTSYEVVISDDCPNNVDVVSIEVPVFDGSNVSAGPDTCIVIGQKYEMQASGGVAYDWDNELTIFGSDMLANTEVGPEETTIYTVEITDANGCTYSDDVEICVVDDPLSIFKEISIITPNDDGKNDELTFPGLEQYDTNELIIFNRWGNVIFEQENYQLTGELFNGTNGGERLPADTYFYVLKFEGNTFKSAITIVYQ